MFSEVMTRCILERRSPAHLMTVRYHSLKLGGVARRMGSEVLARESGRSKMYWCHSHLAEGCSSLVKLRGCVSVLMRRRRLGLERCLEVRLLGRLEKVGGMRLRFWLMLLKVGVRLR